MRLLLHTCCGPCFLGVWTEIRTHSEIKTTLYYYNPNIYPEEEYLKRLENLKEVSRLKKVPLEQGMYQRDDFSVTVNDNNKVFPERCLSCYRIRLSKVAKYAKENGFDAFSTTLFVSPYQQHEELRVICEEIALQFGLILYYTDWRPYFREGQNEAKNNDIYRQRYCGCNYSLNESGK